jgi:peptidoglycan/xylan/chitin deacetylase (PgdA/CDA1 family)
MGLRGDFGESPTCRGCKNRIEHRLMRRALKVLVLRIFKAFGAFALARRVTGAKLRILCYHGISIGDQHEFEPLLYMQPSTFEKRLRNLVAQGWRIVDLTTAVRELREGKIVRDTVVVTIDDGWVSTAVEAAPLLARHGIPATLYVTTYYAERKADVFNVALYYMAWKTKLSRVTLRTGYADIDCEHQLKPSWIETAQRWIEFGNGKLTWEQRQELLRKVAVALELDPDEVFAANRFRIVDAQQIKALKDMGIDIQLHTHRHHLPTESYEALRSEILENQQRLEKWIGARCEHFCYPSGMYTLQQSEWLAQMGLASSTTCDQGFNESLSHPHRLKRILDRDTWCDLEFEAVMSGVTAWFGRRTGTTAPRE